MTTGAGKWVDVVVGVCRNCLLITSDFLIKEQVKSSAGCEDVGAGGTD